MATSFTIGKGNYIRPFRNVRLRSFREAPSQTFKVGDPLILNTTADKGDQVKIAGSDPDGTVVGFATGDASGTENTTVVVAMLDEQAEFIAVVADTQVLDYDDIGDDIGIVADATNVIWRLDRTETTTPVGRIVAFGPKPDGSGGNCSHGDTHGALVFRATAGKQGLLKA